MDDKIKKYNVNKAKEINKANKENKEKRKSTRTDLLGVFSRRWKLTAVIVLAVALVTGSIFAIHSSKNKESYQAFISYSQEDLHDSQYSKYYYDLQDLGYSLGEKTGLYGGDINLNDSSLYIVQVTDSSRFDTIISKSSDQKILENINSFVNGANISKESLNTYNHEDLANSLLMDDQDEYFFYFLDGEISSQYVFTGSKDEIKTTLINLFDFLSK